MFTGLTARVPVLQVFAPGARVQPVFFDVASVAVANAVTGPEAFGGKTFELVGSGILSIMEFILWFARAQGRKNLFAPLPDAVSRLLAALPLMPISGDQLALLQAGYVSTGLPWLAGVGAQGRPVRLFLDRSMIRFRNYGRFGSEMLTGRSAGENRHRPMLAPTDRVGSAPCPLREIYGSSRVFKPYG